MGKSDTIQEVVKTKLGVFPKDWKVSTVGKSLIIENNRRKPISQEDRKLIQGEYPYYGPTKIQDYINEFQYDGFYALIAEDGDHFLKYREHPMTQLASGKFNVNNHAHVLKGTDECLTKWFYWFYNRRSIYSHITRQGAGRYKLNKAALEQLTIVYPNVSEQTKIIEILDQWEYCISTTQKLIDELKLRNKGLAQQLLSGKKRLMGFEDNWEKKKLGKLLAESRVPSQSMDSSKRISVRLNLKGVEKREEKGTESNATAYFIRAAGQFIYGKQNLHKGALGIIPNELDGFESTQDIPAFDFKKGVEPNWLLAFIGRENFYTQLESIATGTGSKRIHPKNLFKIEIPVPSIDEQKAISAVLGQADKELKLYQQQLDTLKEQKKGLMQKLLTGEIRVKVLIT